MKNKSIKNITKGFQIVGLALLLLFFFTKILLFSALGILIGCGGALFETFILYKENGELNYMKVIIFSITFISGIYFLFA